MRFTQTIYAQIPDWARPDNIMQHYARGPQDRSLRHSLVVLLSALIVFGLLAINLILYESGNSLGTGGARTWTIYTVLYFPLVNLQLITLALAMLNASAGATSGPQWEALKITSHGAEFVVRARWAATLYRLRGLIVLVMIPRVLFAGLMLVDVARDGGYHLDLYLFGITPAVPLEIAVIILAALMMHGFRPGPALIRETPEFVYAIFGAMLMANFMFLFLGLAGAKIFSRITLIPRTFLWPSVLVFAVVGTYALNQSPFDVYVMLLAGLFSFVMLRHGFGPAPFVMGLILGRLVEEKWSQAMVIYDNNMLLFLERPIVILFLVLALLGLFWTPLTAFLKKRSAAKSKPAEAD